MQTAFFRGPLKPPANRRKVLPWTIETSQRREVLPWSFQKVASTRRSQDHHPGQGDDIIPRLGGAPDCHLHAMEQVTAYTVTMVVQSMVTSMAQSERNVRDPQVVQLFERGGRLADEAEVVASHG